MVAETRSTLSEGFRAAWDDRAVRGMLLGIAGLAIALDPVNTLSPAFAVDVFGRSGAAAPLFITAFGAGSLAAAFGIGRLFRRAEANIRLGAITLSVMALGMAGFGLSPTYEVGLVALFIAGLGSLATITLFTTGIQQSVPDRVRGRVMAIWTLCALGMRFPAGDPRRRPGRRRGGPPGGDPADAGAGDPAGRPGPVAPAFRQRPRRAVIARVRGVEGTSSRGVPSYP